MSSYLKFSDSAERVLQAVGNLKFNYGHSELFKMVFVISLTTPFSRDFCELNVPLLFSLTITLCLMDFCLRFSFSFLKFLLWAGDLEEFRLLYLCHMLIFKAIFFFISSCHYSIFRSVTETFGLFLDGGSH